MHASFELASVFLRMGFDAFSCCAAGEVVRCVLARSVWKRLATVRLHSLSGEPLAPVPYPAGTPSVGDAGRLIDGLAMQVKLLLPRGAVQ